ncbi:hypothetical protein KL918_001911 [Ogataea parapolymorpha]|uniref:Membrane protein TMS1 n=1 Tax=Ogataea parapolymorpha (strain ATCC 26012 / BCRC 20466 / JCM 22074 / NRRL Y-7560 / DL-1) TaxID=871575 RepID=W1QCE6_OGAPD|nr:Membrane protein TMS1 [Ogataea parapolymorpha DL-1]ESW98697.1 Membrane protein TMS1 [Ogataea parapolymorpha DL-1]KAG7868253.1 hypothetical protein KL918_001911 [Ogataea parapolymorpha]KAG7874127.1 hypothetical protein KL916_001467 [Ogataea parapolymorpha]
MNSQLNPLAGTFKSSVATRVTYAIIFLLNSLLSWVSQTHSLTSMVEKWTWGLFKYGNEYCKKHNCVGFTNVQRLGFSLGLMHLVLASLLIGVKSTSNPRAVIQNGYWMVKLFALALFMLITYWIPDKFFLFWGNFSSVFFSTCFIMISLILLVDFAHEWAETCMERIEEGEIYLDDAETENSCLEGPSFWRSLLVGGTLGMYLGVIVLTIVMYIYFSHSGCALNTTAISLNLVFVLLATALSVSPTVQEYNPNAGLAQSSMCCIYCTYLIFSACLSEPDDKLCNPLVRYSGTRTLSVVLGAFFTFGAVAYTTTRAAANSVFSHSANSNYSSNAETVLGVVSQQPSRKEMRLQAIRQAVNEGSLPESALEDPSYFDDSETDLGEEETLTKYNYALFHCLFFLATQYIAALLTINVVYEPDSTSFVPVGRTYFNFGMKVASSLMCYLLYIWTLVAPVLFPDRFI